MRTYCLVKKDELLRLFTDFYILNYLESNGVSCDGIDNYIFDAREEPVKYIKEALEGLNIKIKENKVVAFSDIARAEINKYQTIKVEGELVDNEEI
ncbi:MAG: 2-hydroxyglutaryl-CoA dehydratase, D-component [Caudoviricetes sp.]|nr:MAG: 2-hydroxyglutaryl-CoA dehydratase, D-component [Caudoviricetes sp.]